MKEATFDPREMREDLIDSLIAISLLTQRMARTLNDLTHVPTTTTQKGEAAYVRHEHPGRCPYRAVRTG